jgi:hypothetical protein
MGVKISKIKADGFYFQLKLYRAETSIYYTYCLVPFKSRSIVTIRPTKPLTELLSRSYYFSL